MFSSETVIGVVPAAGRGERLGLPFPKELWPLSGNGEFFPVARCTVQNLVVAAVKQIVIVTSSSKPSIMEYFGNGSRFGAEVAYVCQESFPEQGISSGLSKALDGAYPWVRGRAVAFGMPDTIVEPSSCFVPLIRTVAAGADLALGLFPTDKPHKFGMVQVGPNSVVERVVDKPIHSDLKLMWGIIAWSSRFTDYLHEIMIAAPTDFASVMNGAIYEGLVAKGIEIPGGRYLDVGTYDDLARLSEFLAR